MKILNLRLNAVAAAALAALAILGFIALPAAGATSVSLNVNLGGPGVVWHQRPHMLLVPGTQISWYQDFSGADVYQDGSWWYCYRDGRWYRSSGYQGPWSDVDMNTVPQRILYVPARYHHFDHGSAMGAQRGQASRPVAGRSLPGNRSKHGSIGNPGRPGNQGGPGHQMSPGNSGTRGNSGGPVERGDSRNPAGHGMPGNPGGPGNGGNPGSPDHNGPGQSGGNPHR